MERLSEPEALVREHREPQVPAVRDLDLIGDGLTGEPRDPFDAGAARSSVKAPAPGASGSTWRLPR